MIATPESVQLRVAEVHPCYLGDVPTLLAWEILARLWKPLVGADSEAAEEVLGHIGLDADPGLTCWQDGRPCVVYVDAAGAVSVTLVLAPAVDPRTLQRSLGNTRINPITGRMEFCCTACSEWKSPEAFARDASRARGYGYSCRPCRNARRRSA